MTDIDTILGRLSKAPVPSRLAAIDGAVLDALAAQLAHSGVPAARPVGMAALAALAIGILGGVPGIKAEAATAASVGEVSPLAPSTLLGGSR